MRCDEYLHDEGNNNDGNNLLFKLFIETIQKRGVEVADAVRALVLVVWVAAAWVRTL